MPTIFGREPAVIIGFLAALIEALGGTVLHLSGGIQGALIALVTAAFGVWTAAHVASDKLLPAVLGFAQAGFSLYIAFGQNVSAGDQAAVMTLITMTVALFVRTQVVVPVPPARPEGE